MKTCRKCGIAKPLSEYHANNSYRDGVQSQCKACVRQYHYPKPVSQGGPHTLDNCRPSCLPCNRRGERKSAA